LDIGDDLLGISRGSRIYHRQVLIVDNHVDVAMRHVATGLIHAVDGNTEKIAKALARGMERRGVKVDCAKVDEVDVNKLIEYDFLAIGGPTHRRNVSAPMDVLLKKLKGVNLKGKKGYAFDTRREHWLAGSAGKEIESWLKGLGMSIVKPYSSAIIFEEERRKRQESESKEEWKERWHGSVGLQENMVELFENIGAEIAELSQ
jgi:flavorubredoxin